ncbi:MAG TPA: hypothetical protein VE596_17285 [Gaiellaceae bacterium]|jgi:hypothetical protein|nr:hypothetical protein [Gaiellaceae bacterium]
MPRRLLACLVASLFAAPAAFAAGPDPGVVRGGLGTTNPGGKIRYVAIGGKLRTTVTAMRRSDGRVLRWKTYRGSFGIPAVTFNGTAGGVSADGSTLVLADTRTGNGEYPLKRRSTFLVIDAKSLQVRSRIDLRGAYSFDALSPDSSRLYLIQHVSSLKLTHYVVRAYDLDRSQLLAGKIADKSQRGWVMNGMPLARATSAGGRWVYTLYQNPGGYPFVHALDAVRGTAHCIGIPYTGSQNAIWNLRLSVRDGGRTLSLHWRSGKPYLAIATGTWRISHPAAPRVAGPGSSGFPWWIFGVAGGAIVLLAAAALVRLRGFGLPGPARAPQA